MRINNFIHTNVTMLTKNNDPYEITVTDSCNDHVGLLFDEMVNYARTLTGPITVAMSGGVDSECVARVLLAAQIQFDAVIMRLVHNSEIYNDHDINYAVAFCNTHGIVYRFFDLPFDEFYKGGENLAIAQQYGINSPQLTTHIKMAKSVDNLLIVGGSIGNLYDTEYGISSYKYDYFDRYANHNDKPVIANLFNASTRILQASINARKSVTCTLNATPTHYLHKIKTLQNGGFNIQPRPNKYTGFEKVKEHYMYETNFIKCAYDKMFRYPLEQCVPSTNINIINIPLSYFL